MATARYTQGSRLYLSDCQMEKFRQDGKGFLKNIWNGIIDSLIGDNGIRRYMECDSNSNSLALIMVDGTTGADTVKEQVDHCLRYWEYGMHIEIKNMLMDAITLKHEDNAIYVTTTLSGRRAMTVYPSSCDKADLWVKYGGGEVIFCFFSDGEVKISSSGKSGRNYYPMAMKMMPSIRESYFNDLMLKEWLKESSKRFPIYKDVRRNYQCDPGSIRCNLYLSEAKDYPTYQHWIQGHYKSCSGVPKSVNKMPLGVAVEKALCCRHIKTNEQQKIYGMGYSLSEGGQTILEAYYKDLLQKEFTYKGESMRDYEKHSFLNDYVHMAEALKLPVSLNFKSFRKVMDAHNALLNPYMRLMAKRAGSRRMTIPKDSPFRKLKLPDGWELIKTGKRLFAESEVMHHCVYDYLSGVNKGKYCICHMEHCGIPYTLQIKIRRKKFVCVQMYGKHDDPAPADVWEYVGKTLENCI